MPETLHLSHDYVAWHDAVLEARTTDRDHWERLAPRLGTFGPGELKISDPSDACGTMVGKALMVMAWNIVGWDMDSPVARGQIVASSA